MRILVIDNNIMPKFWGSEAICRSLRTSREATVHVRRGPQEDLPANPRGFDRVIVSGSLTSALEDAPWIERLHEFIRATIDSGTPLLGICYGHQSIVRALGGKATVRRAERFEIGWTRIEILKDSILTRGLKSPFYSFSTHFDEVCTLPQGAIHLARSEFCEYQAFQLDDRPVFGIQFHPEKDLEDAKRTLAAKRPPEQRKLLLHPNESEKYFDSGVGETLFMNFIKL